MKKLSVITLLCILTASTSVAQDLASYTIALGLSPFGGSLNYTYHKSKKTSVNFAVGGLPETDLAAFASDMDYFSDDLELTFAEAFSRANKLETRSTLIATTSRASTFATSRGLVVL